MAKGYVFSIDATFGLFVAVMLIMAAAFLSYQAQADPYSKVQLERVGHDVLFSLDEQGVLQGGNATKIEAGLDAALPQGVGANATIYTYYYDNGSFNLLNTSQQYGIAVPTDSDSIGLRHDFVTIENGYLTNYSIMRMTIWMK